MFWGRAFRSRLRAVVLAGGSGGRLTAGCVARVAWYTEQAVPSERRLTHLNSYITHQGDTWDLIAYKHFGNIGKELLTSILIDNNQQYISTVIFPAGCVINIPDIDVPTAKTLPPWMRD